MTRFITWSAACAFLLVGCSSGAQTQPKTETILLIGHQDAHPMRAADGLPRTMPDGSQIMLAGGTFELTLVESGAIGVQRNLDDGRSFHYDGQCTEAANGIWECRASDGIGVPLAFRLTLDSKGENGLYQSHGYDPEFELRQADH
jgi:hypothetical protein